MMFLQDPNWRILSVGQAVYIYDFTGLIIYWNSAAENLFAYSASEALGQNGLDLVADSAVDDGIQIAQKIAAGEKWTGAFPVKNKQGKRFEAFGSGTPLYDDYGSIVGFISISSDSRSFLQLPSVLSLKADSSFSQPMSGPALKADHDSQQPQQVVVTLSGSCARRLRGDVPQSLCGVSYKTVHLGKFCRDYGGEGRIGIHKIVNSRGESWVSKKQISQPWNARDGLVASNTHDNFGWMTNEQDDNSGQLKSSDSYEKPDIQLFGSNRFGNKAIGVWSSSEATNTRCVSRSINTGSNPFCSSGTVYHGLWCGSDVAVKVFSKFEYSGDLLHSFIHEVLLMKGLRHPNVLLFMGAVTLQTSLCSGSLFQLLKCSTCKLDWRRRVLMALDIARGTNYLHNCNPPVVHRDLKSSNLLVDKNWTVKNRIAVNLLVVFIRLGTLVSRFKHATFLTTNSGKGTPQWMAPEGMHNDPSNEKQVQQYFFQVLC
ncbi:hypothetical protein C5167_005804 [Papaver somniferum]|uniref:Protein kinase domain-containing protein n=1 Tax=Papaver somniferum TaxID=3469 RepID=A0A4Y7JES6_PAPSO|nr:hypothetical protein C5167_005804 [Papaver somniferum]